MDQTYRFGKKEDQLLRLCKAHVPNMDKIHAVITEGADVNAVDEDGWRLLGAIFSHNSAATGEHFPAIADVFIRAGFDAKRFGLSVMGSLVHSTHDRYIFDTAMILLKAGAHGDKGKWESLLECIGTEESYQRCCDYDHACENIYYAWYEIVRRASEGKSFDDIGVWQDCVGLKVDGIVADANRVPVVTKGKKGKILFRDQFMLLCGERAVMIEACPNIYLCKRPGATDLANPIDLSGQLPFAAGAIIERIDFEHRGVREGKTYYRQPNIHVVFNNGRTIRFSTNFGEVPEEETSKFFEVL